MPRSILPRLAPLSAIAGALALASIVPATVTLNGCGDGDRTPEGTTSLGGPSAGSGIDTGLGGAGGAGGAQGGGGIASAAGGAGGGLDACGGLDAEACYACCAETHPDGVSPFESAFFVCGCADCQLDCAQSLCGGGIEPASGCVDCAVSSVAPGGSCGASADFGAACLDVAACSELVACIGGC